MSYSPVGWLVLVLVVVAAILFFRYPRKKIDVYPRKMTEGKLYYAQSLIWLFSVILLALWSFNVSRISTVQPVKSSASHVLFVLDGSLSMSADDVAPSRFKRSLQLIHQLVEEGSDSTYELIVFSGLPVIRMPWTSDSTGFMKVLSGMQLGDFPPTDNFLGTALGDALLLSIHQFQQIPQESSRSLVVISDGDSNKGYDPYKLLTLLQQQNISVYFIALGEEGYEVGKDALGLPVITSFDTNLMQQFTDQTAGRLYRNPGGDEMASLAELLSRGEQELVEYAVERKRLNTYLLPWLLVSLSILLLLQLRRLVYIKRK